MKKNSVREFFYDTSFEDYKPVDTFKKKFLICFSILIFLWVANLSFFFYFSGFFSHMLETLNMEFEITFVNIMLHLGLVIVYLLGLVAIIMLTMVLFINVFFKKDSDKVEFLTRFEKKMSKIHKIVSKILLVD